MKIDWQTNTNERTVIWLPRCCSKMPMVRHNNCKTSSQIAMQCTARHPTYIQLTHLPTLVHHHHTQSQVKQKQTKLQPNNNWTAIVLYLYERNKRPTNNNNKSNKIKSDIQICILITCEGNASIVHVQLIYSVMCCA